MLQQLERGRHCYLDGGAGSSLSLVPETWGKRKFGGQAMTQLQVKNYAQQSTSVATATGTFNRIVRVTYDVYDGQTLVGHFVHDYQPAQATTTQITTDMQADVRELRARLDSASAIS